MSKPIGVFDSGVGGLTVLGEIQRALPLESTLYLGDNTRVPYGTLPVGTIRRYTVECLDHLYREGVKALVIACNTATAAALEVARARYDVPMIGVIGSTARAAAAVARRRVGIVATRATVNSGEYLAALRAENPELEVFQQPCSLLVMQVEAGEFATPRTEMMLEAYLRLLRDQEVDTLVLGCTHYGFLRSAIERLMGREVHLVECGPSAVASLVALMEEGKLERASQGPPVRRIMTTGNVQRFRQVAAALWPGTALEIQEVNVEGEGGGIRREAA